MRNRKRGPSAAGRTDAQRERRIAEIKQELQAIAGGSMREWECQDLPLAARERFWEEVLEFETAPKTTDFDRLRRSGIELPAPDSLDEPALSTKLAELIAALAGHRVFLGSTNHLSDRELYCRLWTDTLREEVPDTIDGGASHVDMCIGESEEHIRAYLTYYADDRERQWWLRNYPEEELPPRQEPPYDRDRHLPQPYASRKEKGRRKH